MDKFALIGEDIHKLVRIKEGEPWDKYAWRIHYEKDYYFVPVKDESKHGYKPLTHGYRRKRIFNNFEIRE